MTSHPPKKRGWEVHWVDQKQAGWAAVAPSLLFLVFSFFWAAPVLKFQTSFLVQGSFSALPLERCFDCRNLSLKIDLPSSILSLDNPYWHLVSLLPKTQKNQTKSRQNSDKNSDKNPDQNSDKKIQTEFRQKFRPRFRQKFRPKFRQKFRQHSDEIQTDSDKFRHIWINRNTFKQVENTKFSHNNSDINSDTKISDNNSDTKTQTKIQTKFRQQCSDKNSDQNSDTNADKNSAKIQAKNQTKIQTKIQTQMQTKIQAKIQTKGFRQKFRQQFRQDSDTMIQTQWFRHKNSDTKNQTKIQTKFRQKFRQRFRPKFRPIFRPPFRQNSDKSSDKNSDKKSDKIQTKFRQIRTCLNRLKHYKPSGNFRQISDKNSDKIQTKIQTKFRQKFRQNSDKNSDKRSDKNSDQKSEKNSEKNSEKISDKDSDKIQTKITVKFRHKSDRMAGRGIFGCSGSFQKVLFILKMQLQKGFSCFQKTLKFSSPIFVKDTLFVRGFFGVHPPFFYKDGGGLRKGDASPFLISLWIASSGTYKVIFLKKMRGPPVALHVSRYTHASRATTPCPADGVWRIGRGVSPNKVRKTRFTPSESFAGHGLLPQRAPYSVQRMVSGG